MYCLDENVAASFGRGRRSAATNRSRQQLQREQALLTAAKQKAALGGSPLSPKQQLQPALTSAPPPALTSAPPPPSSDKVPKQDLQQVEPETVTIDSEDPPSAVKELDKQEVELLVSLMQGWVAVIWCPCMNIPHFILWFN